MNTISIEFPDIIDVRCTRTGKVWTVNQQHPAKVPDGTYEISHDAKLLDFRHISNPVCLSGEESIVISNIKYAQ